MNPSNFLKIKNQIPSNVNILAVSKGFKSQDIQTIQNLGHNDFGESKFQEAFEKQLILKDLQQIKWHFIGRIQSNKIRKIVQNFRYIHSVDTFEKLEKISNISFEEKKNPSI
ncbi:YggS family pyridoxal phosphate-dependent enzyme, partial [bacterium]|nr:YggS family pyridoxal phosphate-dependent enzyme [bacterium]